MTLFPVARDADTAEFFDACNRGEFLLRFCGTCERYGPPPAKGCVHCASSNVSWVVSRGTGSLLSWSIVHGKAPAPKVVIGLIELDEGPWFHARITDIDTDAVTVGQRLQVGFVNPGQDSETIPVFHPERDE